MPSIGSGDRRVLSPPARRPRSALPAPAVTPLAVATVVVAAALWAGFGSVANPSGWDAFGRFWAAALDPRLDTDFLVLAAEATADTVAFAVLGTALSIGIGLAVGPILARVSWDLDGIAPSPLARSAWAAMRLVAALPRAAHEIVWALALVQIFGLDPMVAVVAIGVPFGLVTARVYADTLDSVERSSHRLLRAQGATRTAALVTAIVPAARLDLMAYAFYRLECAIRSAAILGIVGAGGLGYQLSLSFQSLHYDEVWTLIWALVVVSGLADLWSSRIRDRADRSVQRRRRSLDVSLAGLALAIPAAWWWVGVEPGIVWSARTRRLAADLADRSWPPTLGDRSLLDLLVSSVDTAAMAVLAIALAGAGAFAVAFVAGGALRPVLGVGARPHQRLVLVVELAAKGLLLLARAVPPPVWAFIVVLVLLPGTWPGAVALGVYNLGVLGRLQAEVVDNELRDDRAGPTRLLLAAGASPVAAFVTATVPRVQQRFRALTAYRWEVAVRETMVVGVVGASGLGRDLNDQLAGRAFSQATSTILALVVLTLAVDVIAARAGGGVDRRRSTIR